MSRKTKLEYVVPILEEKTLGALEVSETSGLEVGSAQVDLTPEESNYYAELAEKGRGLNQKS